MTIPVLFTRAATTLFFSSAAIAQHQPRPASQPVPETSAARLTAHTLAPAAGEPLRLSFLVGANASPQAWSDSSLHRVFVRGDGTQSNRHHLKPADNADFVEIALEPDASVQLVGADIQRPVRTLLRADAETRLRELELPASALPAAQDTLRLREYESAAFIVRVADVDHSPNAVVMSKSGLSAEIRLMVDPHSAAVGDLIPFCTYLRGDKSKSLVTATHEDTGERAEVTAGSGASYFRVSRAGRWRLELNDVRQAEEIDGVDVLLFRGSIVFETGGAAK